MVTYMLRRSQNPHGVPFRALGVMKPLSDAQWSFIERLCVHRSSIYFYGTHCYNAVVRSLSGVGGGAGDSCVRIQLLFVIVFLKRNACFDL